MSRFVQRQSIAGDDFGIEVRTVLRRALQTCEVDVHDPMADPQEAVEEYGLELRDPGTGAYDGIVIAVAEEMQIPLAQLVLWKRPKAR